MTKKHQHYSSTNHFPDHGLAGRQRRQHRAPRFIMTHAIIIISRISDFCFYFKFD
jgi:hypothetical protein